MDKIQLIIDCDPGVDDALAIILALKHPAIEVLAICSVAGNGHIETTTQNGLKILSLCDREDIPLYLVTMDLVGMPVLSRRIRGQRRNMRLIFL